MIAQKLHGVAVVQGSHEQIVAYELLERAEAPRRHVSIAQSSIVPGLEEGYKSMHLLWRKFGKRIPYCLPEDLFARQRLVAFTVPVS